MVAAVPSGEHDPDQSRAQGEAFATRAIYKPGRAAR
jgi:hypothetical protein